MQTKTRTSLYIGIIILIILLAGISFYQKSVSEPYVASDTTGASPNDDTDRDGLKNWEETLWKTNPNLADTDGDGTGDGEEIALGRDPLVAGPDDFLSGILFDGSNTDNLAVNLLSSYVETINSNGTTVGNAQNIVNKTLETNIIKPLVITYSPSDLHYVGDTVENYKAYGNNFANLFSYFENSPDEIYAVTNAMQRNSPDELIILDDVIDNYQSFLSNLIIMSVPSGVGTAHLSAVNSLSALIADINGMKLLFSDTIVAAESIANYQITAKQVQSSFSEIIEKIIESGAEYSTDEIGYGLVNII